MLPTLEHDVTKVSALEFFVGFDSNEITYLEYNVLGNIRQALKQVIAEAKASTHLTQFLQRQN